MRKWFAAIVISMSSSAHADGLAAWILQIQRITSAIKIETKQEQVSKQSNGINYQNAVKSEVQAKIERANIEAVRNTLVTYGPTSQLVDPCYQVGVAKTTVEAKERTDANALNAATRIYTIGENGYARSPGLPGVIGLTKKVSGYYYSADIAKRSERHFSRYCTVSEASAGYCALNSNGMQGGDSDFSLHITPGVTYGWDQVESATDFVKTIVPAHPAMNTADCNSVECRASLVSARQQEVRRSMARYSMLRFVESRSTQISGDAKKVQ